jgi:hypothetical protein
MGMDLLGEYDESGLATDDLPDNDDGGGGPTEEEQEAEGAGEAGLGGRGEADEEELEVPPSDLVVPVSSKGGGEELRRKAGPQVSGPGSEPIARRMHTHIFCLHAHAHNHSHMFSRGHAGEPLGNAAGGFGEEPGAAAVAPGRDA